MAAVLVIAFYLQVLYHIIRCSNDAVNGSGIYSGKSIWNLNQPAESLTSNIT